MANMASFRDLTIPYLPGAEVGIIDLHARRVLREFFKRTTVWRESVDFVTSPGNSDYRITMPTGQDVATILNVLRDPENGDQKKPLGKATETVRAYPREPSRPRAWHFALPQVVSVWPVPDGVYNLTAELAITLPITFAGEQEFPDDVFATYGEDIAAGIIGYMMGMPGKPWTQVQAGGGYVNRYENCVKTLRAKLRDGGSPNVSTARGPKIA